MILGSTAVRARTWLLALLLCLAAPAAAAQATVDTSGFAATPPWKIGVSAGYLSNSWVVFALQYIKYEASLHPEVGEIIVTDAGFDANKQAADIEDLLSQGIDLLIFWAVDNEAVQPALDRAASQGVPIVSVGEPSPLPQVTSQASIDQYALGHLVAEHLATDMNGQGGVVAMLPLPGTYAATAQLEALNDVLAANPGMQLLSVEYGQWSRSESKRITENLLLRYPRIDGVFSPSGQMSLGIAEAFDEAGRLDEVTFSPGDEYNGWLKWVAEHGQGGAVTFPTRAGQVAMQLAVAILKGEPVPANEPVASEYVSPADNANWVELDRPDDWWATELPEDWKPAP